MARTYAVVNVNACLGQPPSQFFFIICGYFTMIMCRPILHTSKSKKIAIVVLYTAWNIHTIGPPVHCVKGTKGFAFSGAVVTDRAGV